MVVASSLAQRPADPRLLITPQLFDRLTARIVRDHDAEPAYAARVMGQALAFLPTCAHDPRARLSPSAAVDIGWHTFVLDTREYATFCQRVAGQFIHHVPDSEESSTLPQACATATVAATATAVASAGWAVDDDLWTTAGDCTGDCASDPPALLGHGA